jgi:ferredoxin
MHGGERMTAGSRGPAAVAAVGVRLHVDPTRCDGVAICRHLAPELIGLDRWGYPLLAAGSASAELDGDELAVARRAVTACPHRALLLSP